MAKKRYISDAIWTDSWFENQTTEKKLLFIYLITNKLVSICGFYEITIRQIAFDTGIDKNNVEKYLLDFERDGKVFFKDGIICIVNFVKNQNVTSEGDNLWKGIVREINELGEEKLSILLKDKGLTRGLQGAYKGVPIPYLTLLNLTLPNLTHYGENSENLPKKEIYIGATRLEAIEELDKILEHWNITWKEKRKKTIDLENVYLQARKKYTKDDIQQAYLKYREEKKDKEKQFRLDPYRFFKQSNGFITYL